MRDRNLRCDLHHRLCQLLNLELDDQLLKVALRARILLLDDQLTFRFAVALDLALQLVESLDHVRLNATQLLLQIFDEAVDIGLARELLPLLLWR